MPDETYTRRICAILIGDVTGYSALVGEDDERTARAVKQLQAVVRTIVADANGYVEARAGDAIFASFDSVVAAANAALAIHRRIAEEDFQGQRLQIRIGLHFGDVLVRDGASLGEGVGDAINIAARLQTLARPGTVCMSESVYLQVRQKFDETFVDLGTQQLKNIPYPVHAYLMVPREAGEPARRVRRSALRWAAFATAGVLLLVAAVLLIPRLRSAPVTKPLAGRPPVPQAEGLGSEPQSAPASVSEAPEAQAQVALGVMLFKSLGGDAENDWRREALRDGLNTQLSQLSRVKVYSKEFLDFLISRKGLTEIEAATQLGITKMLSGSFVVVGGTLRIETHIVDVRTGVLEGSYTTVGNERDFLDLQNKVVLGAISRLDLPVTAAEKQMLLARRNTDEEALKMLLEAEGGAAPSSPDPEPHSALPQWFVRLRWLGPAAAWADDTVVRSAILDAIEHYRRAMERHDLQALAALYLEFPPEQQAAQQRYFDNVRDLKISIDNPDIAVVGDEAVVSYTRTDDFVDARTGRPMHVAVRLTKILRQQDGAWKMAGK